LREADCVAIATFPKCRTRAGKTVTPVIVRTNGKLYQNGVVGKVVDLKRLARGQFCSGTLLASNPLVPERGFLVDAISPVGLDREEALGLGPVFGRGNRAGRLKSLKSWEFTKVTRSKNLSYRGTGMRRWL
jgi:hypothetical protein